MKNILLSAALLSITSLPVLAEQTSKTYDVKRGSAQSYSISQTEQLGNFRAVMSSGSGLLGLGLTLDQLVLEGTIKGALNPNFTLNHTFVNKDRTGVIYTANDSITNIFAGDFTCQNGTGSTPFEIEETLNIVAGTGIYANIEQGSYIVLKGVINNCPSLPNYGQNNFDVVGGSISFTQ